MYDYIVIGSGISGVYIANYLKATNKNFLLLEQKKRIGGRIKTYNDNNILYETGAYRFNNDHKKLLHLINKLNLNQFVKKINNNQNYFLRNNHSKIIYNTKNNLNFKNIINRLLKLDKNELMNNDILTLVNNYYDNETKNFVKDYCGYDHFISKSSAITLIKYKKLIESNFYYLTCGLTKIIDLLFENIKNNSILGCKIIDIKKSNNIFSIITNTNTKYKCKNVILAIPKDNLIEVPFILNNINYLNSVESSPYIRIYAKYPKKGNEVWFKDINYTITDNIIRKIIPIDIEKGLIQICYNDGENAEYIRNIIANGNIKEFIHNSLKKIFPGINIPEPEFLNCHYWKSGTHTWLPTYNNYNIEKYMLNPMKGIYISGESYSNNQAWIEGALETSYKIIDIIKNKKKTLKQKKYNYYTMEEVQKHNNHKSAWCVLNNKVFNITNIIKETKHPGGNVIEMAMGKDITDIFESIGHSDYSKNLLNNFFIGFIK
jgi:cytochrome b involved in lipid metabolism